jgi:Mg-chelatase subunit ChlD
MKARVTVAAAALLLAAATTPSVPLLHAQQAPGDSAGAQPPDSATVAIGDIVTVRIEQARQSANVLRVFLFAHDRAGESAASAPPMQAISAFVARTRVPVDTARGFRPGADGTAFLFLVDVSRSVQPPQFEQMRQALAQWRRRLGDADRAALLTFGDDVRLISDFSADSAAFLEALNGVERSADRTRFHEALIRALEIARQGGAGMPARRIIVTLSDGVDDVVGGPTRDEVLHALSAGPVPIYGIGFAQPPVDQTERAGLQALGEFARISGGRYIDGSTIALDSLFARVHAQVDAVHVLDLDCSACPNDGNVYRLSIDVSDGTRRLSDGMDVRLFPDTATSAAAVNPATEGRPLLRTPWGAAAMALLVLGGLGATWFARRSRPAPVSVLASAVPASSAAVAGNASATPSATTVPVTPVPGPASASVGSTLPLRKDGAATARPMRIRATPLAPNASLGGRTLSLTDRTTIGRDPAQAEVAFRDESSVSSVHCALIRDGDRLFVEDLHSTNGTFVNGVPVKGRHRIHDDDVIRLGQFEVRLRILTVAK